MPRSRRHKHGHHSYYSLYNVVAGRHRHELRDPTRTGHSRLAERALAPDEYLLRRWSKLQMYPFEDHPDLPDSSLVMAIHWYVSKRAAALGPEAFEYMDASALLAIAVEIEEQMNAALGKYGHLVYAQSRKPEIQEPEPEPSDTEAEEEVDNLREVREVMRPTNTEAGVMGSLASNNANGVSLVDESNRTSFDHSSSDQSSPDQSSPDKLAHESEHSSSSEPSSTDTSDDSSTG